MFEYLEWVHFFLEDKITYLYKLYHYINQQHIITIVRVSCRKSDISTTTGSLEQFPGRCLGSYEPLKRWLKSRTSFWQKSDSDVLQKTVGKKIQGLWKEMCEKKRRGKFILWWNYIKIFNDIPIVWKKFYLND